MKTLGRIFLSGLAAVVPLAITAALLIWLGVNAEQLLGGMVRLVLPDAWVFPGLGLVLGIVLVFGIGVLMQLWIFRRLFDVADWLLARVPLVKSIYGAAKDVMQMVSKDDKEKAGKPVIVRIPGRDEALLGFVTRRSVGARFGGEGLIAVYLPMSYQIGGYTVLMPPERVEPLEIGAREAMRFVLTAGMGVTEKPRGAASR
ncbi:MAG: DUF502 domain-containing protein [Gammaproteobacteria bacterium]|nr:DUF502 domain-containing protein [Gammaproteobacteria bacterium]